MLKNILIIGGTSGLGLELAKIYSTLGHTIFITVRKNPGIPNLRFFHLSIDQSNQNLVSQIDELIQNIDKINTLIYVAGYYQEGRIDQLNDREILEMINVGLTAPAIIIQRLKNNPGKPLKIVLVTSSAQYTPRELESMYTAVKSGLGMLGASLSLDPTIGKVLVVAPSRMKTPFWSNNHNTSEYLNPTWVAEQIVELSSGPFKYRFAKILRSPERVEIVETKQ
jgi:short-subunit dehydrogenase